MNKIINVFKFLILFLFVLGVFLLIRGVSENITLKNKTKDYVKVDGYFVDSEIYSEAKRIGRRYKNATYRLIYSYHVDEVDYTIKTDYGVGGLPSYGSVKTILYDPLNPSEAVICGTNGAAVQIYAGMFFTLFTSVFIFIGLEIKGVFKKFKVNMMDVIIGIVFLVIGIATLNIILGSFSLGDLLRIAGILAAIPILFIVVGIHMIWRGFFSKQENSMKKQRKRS